MEVSPRWHFLIFWVMGFATEMGEKDEEAAGSQWEGGRGLGNRKAKSPVGAILDDRGFRVIAERRKWRGKGQGRTRQRRIGTVTTPPQNKRRKGWQKMNWDRTTRRVNISRRGEKRRGCLNQGYRQKNGEKLQEGKEAREGSVGVKCDKGPKENREPILKIPPGL